MQLDRSQAWGFSLESRGLAPTRIQVPFPALDVPSPTLLSPLAPLPSPLPPPPGILEDQEAKLWGAVGVRTKEIQRRVILQARGRKAAKRVGWGVIRPGLET